jgi:hypothetical protein
MRDNGTSLFARHVLKLGQKTDSEIQGKHLAAPLSPLGPAIGSLLRRPFIMAWLYLCELPDLEIYLGFDGSHLPLMCCCLRSIDH